MPSRVFDYLYNFKKMRGVPSSARGGGGGGPASASVAAISIVRLRVRLCVVVVFWGGREGSRHRQVSYFNSTVLSPFLFCCRVSYFTRTVLSFFRGGGGGGSYFTSMEQYSPPPPFLGGWGAVIGECRILVVRY